MPPPPVFVSSDSQVDHDRGIRNEERHKHNDAAWVAHAAVHALEGQALVLQHHDDERRLEGVEARIAVIENWKNKATGAAVILALFAGALGAAIVKALGG